MVATFLMARILARNDMHDLYRSAAGEFAKAGAIACLRLTMPLCWAWGRWARPRRISWPRRGAKVLGIDQYAPPHEFGSTHGDTRITRIACGEGPEYSAFAARSHEIWRELEAETGLDLLTQNGFLAISGAGQRSANHGVAKFLDATVAAAKAAEVSYELLDSAALRQRYPALNIADGDSAYHDERERLRASRSAACRPSCRLPPRSAPTCG